MPAYLQLSVEEECCLRARQQCHCQSKDVCTDPRKRNCRKCCRRCNRNPPTCFAGGKRCTAPSCPGAATCGNAPEGTCLDGRNCDQLCPSLGFINHPPKGYFEEVKVCGAVKTGAVLANTVVANVGKFCNLDVDGHCGHDSRSSSRSSDSFDHESLGEVWDSCSDSSFEGFD